MDASIGIIDSGVGGLTVVKEVMKRLPNESIIYIGDRERCPYGPRPAEEVRAYTIEMAAALSKMGIKLLVVACNTATAIALDDIRELFSFPIIGVITPGARSAVNATKTGKITVLGTTATIKSRAYDYEIWNLLPDATVYRLACPDFVAIVESGQYNSEEASKMVRRTLGEIEDKDFDAVILGCTHFPLLEKHFESQLPKHVKIISSAIETARDVEQALLINGIRNLSEKPVQPIFFSTGSINNFRDIVTDWLSIKEPDVRHIQL
ncbi:glutamate racemase [Sporosarcina sp. CAU 1771]